MKNTIIIDGFTWVQVPVDMIEHLDCEVFILHDDGSESLIDGDRHYMYDDLTYVIEPNEAAMASAWLNANGYNSYHVGGDVVLRLESSNDKVLHVILNDYTKAKLSDRFGMEELV